MGELIAKVIFGIRTNKKKILFALVSFVLFAIALFPFDDLSDLVTEKIAQATQNQVFIKFDHLGLAFLPPSLEMDKVEVQTPFFPTVRASSMTLAPAIARFLAFKPGVRFSADDIFKGDLSGSVGMISNKDKKVLDFDVDYDQFDLQTVSKFFESTWEVSGQATVGFKGSLDPEFGDQPKVEIEIDGQKVVLPNTLPPNIPVIGGTIIPQIQWGSLKLEGSLAERELKIENGVIGQDTDPLSGAFKGQIQVTFQRAGTQVVPIIGGYDLRLDLRMDRTFESDLQRKLTIVYDVLAKYRTATGKGSRYLLRVSAPNSTSVPEVTAVSSL